MKTPRQSPDGGASDRNIKRRTEVPMANGSSGADDGLFISPEKKSSFERSYRHRKVINGSKVAFSGPEGGRIAGNIEAIGLTPMTTMDLPVYPRLVRLFFCNLEFNLAETSVTSLVNGTPISLDCRSLAAILGIPNKGAEYFQWYAHDSSRWPTTKDLPAKERVLLDMLLPAFLPRRHHGRVSEMDKFVMNKILSGEKLNLCLIIIFDMIDLIISRREDLDLPYGMLLTKVFNAFDVAISREEEFETMDPRGHSDFFEGGGIRINAGWRSGSLLQEVEVNDDEGGGIRINAGWRPGSLLQEVEANDEEDEEETPATETESLSLLDRQADSISPSVEDLQCQPEQGFAILDEPLSKLTARVDCVDSKLSALVDSVASLVQDGRCRREEGLANLNETLGKLTARVDSLDGKFTARVDSVTSSVWNHRCQQVQGLTNLNKSLGKRTTQVDSVASSVQELRCQQEEVFTNLNESLSKVAARVDSVDSNLNARVYTLASSVKDLQCQQEQVFTKLNQSLSQVAARADSSDGMLSARVDSVDSKLTALVDSVDSKLTARVDTVASSVQSLRCEQEKRFADLNTKLDCLFGYLNYHFCPYPPPPTPFNG